MSSSSSPALAVGDTVSFTIKVKGKAIPTTFQVYSIDTWSSANKTPKARVVIFDGEASEQNFEISNLDTFVPGNNVEISAGYVGDKEKVIFKGIIVKQGIEISRNEGSKLVVDIADPALKMTLERKNAIFAKFRDSSLIGKLIGDNGLKPSVERTEPEYEEIVQYYATDWDLMMTRAEMNGFLVIANGGEVTVKRPDTTQSPVFTLEYGTSILDLQAEMDAGTQYSSSAIKSYTWSATNQKLVEAGPGMVNVQEQGNISSEELSKVFKVKKFSQQSGAPLEEATLKTWSSAELLKSKLSKIRGCVSFQGSALAQTGKTVKLAGLGKRFNGIALMTGIHHSIQGGIWLTTAEFGLSSQWFAAEAPGIAAPEASGQLPPISGLQTGIVKKIAQDPGGEFRVFISLPLLQESSKGVWARLATLYASNKVGAVFYPEVNDEVIVAFMNNDPRYPVILGSVYSKKLAPLYPPDEKNTRKAITTKAKLEILFNDADKIIEIKTPGKHIIKMDDKSGAISVKDSNSNTVSLSKGGIALDSGSNIKITAKGNITVEAKGNLKLSALGNASMDGAQVSHKAKVKFSANGPMSELTASVLAKVQGTLVKIN